MTIYRNPATGLDEYVNDGTDLHVNMVTLEKIKHEVPLDPAFQTYDRLMRQRPRPQPAEFSKKKGGKPTKMSIKPYQCPICKGTGEVLAGYYEGNDTKDEEVEECRLCNGRGVIECAILRAMKSDI